MYKFEEAELVAFFKKAYEQGVYGYLDLRDEVAANLLEECKDHKELVAINSGDIREACLNIDDFRRIIGCENIDANSLKWEPFEI